MVLSHSSFYSSQFHKVCVCVCVRAQIIKHQERNAKVYKTWAKQSTVILIFLHTQHNTTQHSTAEHTMSVMIPINKRNLDGNFKNGWRQLNNWKTQCFREKNEQSISYEFFFHRKRRTNKHMRTQTHNVSNRVKMRWNAGIALKIIKFFFPHELNYLHYNYFIFYINFTHQNFF